MLRIMIKIHENKKGKISFDATATGKKATDLEANFASHLLSHIKVFLDSQDDGWVVYNESRAVH